MATLALLGLGNSAALWIGREPGHDHRGHHARVCRYAGARVPGGRTDARRRRRSRPAGRSGARTEPDGVAYRAKRLGLYEERTWRDYARPVARCAHGLRALGLRRGERVAIMGDACEEWVIADLGAQAAGAVDLRHLPHRVGRRGGIPAARRRRIALRRRGPGVRRQGAAAARSPARAALDRGDRRLGDVRLRRPADHALRRLCDGGGAASRSSGCASAHRRRTTPAFIVYTSGTTGNPKGALVTHGTHVAAARNMIEHYPLLAEPGSAPWSTCRCATSSAATSASRCRCWAARRRISARTSRTCRARCYEVAPTVLFTVPRYLQKFASQVLIRIGSTTPLKARAYDMAMKAGRRHAQARWDGQAAGAPLYALARLLVFRPLLEQLGLRRGRARDLGRRAAAGRNRRAVADLGREPRRDLRPDRGGRRHHHRPARAVPAARATSARWRRAGSSSSAKAARS